MSELADYGEARLVVRTIAQLTPARTFLNHLAKFRHRWRESVNMPAPSAIHMRFPKNEPGPCDFVENFPPLDSPRLKQPLGYIDSLSHKFRVAGNLMLQDKLLWPVPAPLARRATFRTGIRVLYSCSQFEVNISPSQDLTIAAMSTSQQLHHSTSHLLNISTSFS